MVTEGAGRACGDWWTVRASHATLAEQLTSRELQVALIVAGGATTREAGAALFLTPKTIEFHLAKIYRKLDLRSRTELARRFADRAHRPCMPRGST
ncbi:MAG: helix-turn-helix domain-containing protein [Candidatus Limnocylindrales bacterium]